MDRFDLLERLQQEEKGLDKRWKLAQDNMDRMAVISAREMLWRIMRIVEQDD
ncbi:MAG: hypothetical protein ACRCVJ_11790 [Clostridium sp.]|uniref:hypothetical protein n=1 Tax=Clostridium sp. TaxID=1506 RepID=UPI003F37AB93